MVRDQDRPLSEAAARFELLFNHSVDGVFYMTFDEPIRWDATADREALLDYAFDHLRLTAVNAAMCSQLGAEREQLLGTVPRDRWHGDPATWRTKMAQLYDQGTANHLVRAPRSDGTWIDVLGEYVCLYDHEGRITGHFGTQRDISEERKTADRLELAIIGGDVGIWDQDLVTGSLYIDERWVARLGYSSVADQTKLGEWWMSRMHPADRASTEAALIEHLAGRTPIFRDEFRIEAAAGGYRWILSTGRVISRDPTGRPLRIVGSVIDITERRALQERVMLAERMASIGTLAAGVGHEINNPLTYIILNLRLIERELKTLDPERAAKMQRMVDQARYGADRVTSIVRELQSLTRMHEDHTGVVDPRAVVERCLAIVDHQIRHRARVVTELSAIPNVHGSEGRLVQLILNLLINAAHAIPEGDAEHNRITIATSTDVAGHGVITVSDSGTGIAADAIDHIFDPFFTTKPVGEGTGLGLAICRSIVTSLEGEIEVDSVPGRGTTFRVTLPPTTAPQPISTPTPVAAVRPMRVLIVDDEPLIGDMLRRVLVEHEVAAETSAGAALARLRRGEQFDRILCDVMMPDISGMDFYERLADIDPAIRERVVFLTGGAFTERARLFLQQVPNRRLNKPFDLDSLAAALAD